MLYSCSIAISLIIFVLLLQIVELQVTKRYCPNITLKNGKTRIRQRGRFVKFLCNKGYILAGDRYSTCHLGKWDTPIPKCVRPNCTKVTPPNNGLIYPSYGGAVLNFFCKPGYYLKGSNSTSCDGQFWDNKLPTCLSTNSSPPLFCDFENGLDLCGWNQDLNHDFDWTRTNHKTPTGHGLIATGPSYDHTKGKGNDGFYLYIESTSKILNETARLISPIYDGGLQDVCFQFYYHMYGRSIGQLRAYIKKISDDWDLEAEKAFFLQNGNHGDEWLECFHNLGVIKEDFQVIIEGVSGNGHAGDIAIDDIKIIKNCITTSTSTNLIYSETESTSEFPTAPALESCLGKCGNEPIFNNLDNTIQCTCDYSCADQQTCCPDFAELCILGTDITEESTSLTTINYDLTTPLITTLDEELSTFISTTNSPTSRNIFYKSTMKLYTTRKVKLQYTKKLPTKENEDIVLSIVDRDKIIAQETKGSGTNNLLAIIIASVSGTCVIFIILLVSIRRCRHSIPCGGSCKIKRYNNRDSLSDVHFLTADEVLNFNLAHPDDSA